MSEPPNPVSRVQIVTRQSSVAFEMPLLHHVFHYYEYATTDPTSIVVNPKETFLNSLFPTLYKYSKNIEQNIQL